MTIAEIKKALECCHEMAVKCGECPLYNRKGDLTDGKDCDDVLHDEILKVWDNMVQVVRCKDCIHRQTILFGDGENVRFNACELNHNKVQGDDWFCADGERR